METMDLDSSYNPLSVDDSVNDEENNKNENMVDETNISHGATNIMYMSQIPNSEYLHYNTVNQSEGLNIPETAENTNVLDLLMCPTTSDAEQNVICLEGETSLRQLQAAQSVIDSNQILHEITKVQLVSSDYTRPSGDSYPVFPVPGDITITKFDLVPSQGNLTFTTLPHYSQLSESLQEKAFTCLFTECGKSFYTKQQLKAHYRIHATDPVVRQFKCRIDGCEKNFTTNYALKTHLRVHSGEKPYKCQESTCVKAFKTSGDLQKHVRTHTGERPFKCPFDGCNRAFTTSNIRKVHIRTHTGERPYICNYEGCNRTFASATNHKNHIRIHSGEKPYLCTFEGCQKRFTEYSSLYKHHVVHTPTKPYQCDICKKCYRQNSTLAMHRRHNHCVVADASKDIAYGDNASMTKAQCEERDKSLAVETDTTQKAELKSNTEGASPLSSTSGFMRIPNAQQFIVMADSSQIEALKNLAKNCQIIGLRGLKDASILSLAPLQNLADKTDAIDESKTDTNTDEVSSLTQP